MTAYRFGPYRLVPEQRRLECDGVPLTLTPKAFDVLVALVRQRHRALSKDDLLAAVWPGVAVEEGNLAQQVMLLRRALAADGDLVTTIPRHGYRFVGAVVEELEGGGASAPGPHCLIWEHRAFQAREGITIIGRADDADVRISLPSVSRHHARVVVRGFTATLEDLKSRHGTWRGAIRLEGVAPLVSGDEFRIGTAVLGYHLTLPGETTMD